MLLVATHLYTPLLLSLTLVMLSRDVKPVCVIKMLDVFCSARMSSYRNQLTDGSGLPSTSQEKSTSVPSSTDWLSGPVMMDGRTSVGPKTNKEKKRCAAFF